MKTSPLIGSWQKEPIKVDKYLAVSGFTYTFVTEKHKNNKNKQGYELENCCDYRIDNR